MARRTPLTGVFLFTLVLVLGSIGPRTASAIGDREREVRLERNGAGFHVGSWRVHDLETANGTSEETPVFEGYLQRGLDLHLALESSLGFWRRTQVIDESGGLGSATHERVQSYIIPSFTGIKFFPLTRPGDPVEPYLGAGVGFAFGIEDSDTETSIFGGGTSSSSNTAFLGGFGFKAGSGLEWWFSHAFGLSGGARYQWLRFGQEVGGKDTYKGFVFDAGLAYRFQYE